MAFDAYFNQSTYEVRCEWGERGARALAPLSDVIVIVDVLSFSTAVDVAVSRGAVVYPFAGEGAAEFAAARGALLASPGRAPGGYSLSPASLMALPAGAKLVLPSLNGATLTLAAREAAPSAVVFAGCLRNVTAVAAAARRFGRRIAVIAAGERWPADRSLRPALEDWLGAGAIIARLPGSRSPEAEMAAAAFEMARADLPRFVRDTGSGRELIGRGFADDVVMATQEEASGAAPRLTKDAYFA